MVFSCQGHNEKYSGIIINNQITDTVLVPKDSNQLYFPLKISRDISSTSRLDSFTDTWYSKQLFAMREPVIYLNKSDKELYRFTWLRTFDNPIAIRIENKDDSYFLYWKQCNGAGGYEPGKLIVNKQRKIDKKIWNKFKKYINKIDFWDLKTDVNESGCDGSQWILEGKNSIGVSAVCQAHHSLARFLSGDREASTKSPT